MEIIVYGTGCKSCEMLHNNVQNVVKENAIKADIIYEKSLKVIMEKGIIQLPALSVDGKIKSMGRVPKEKEILLYLK